MICIRERIPFPRRHSFSGYVFLPALDTRCGRLYNYVERLFTCEEHHEAHLLRKYREMDSAHDSLPARHSDRLLRFAARDASALRGADFLRNASSHSRADADHRARLFDVRAARRRLRYDLALCRFERGNASGNRLCGGNGGQSRFEPAVPVEDFAPDYRDDRRNRAFARGRFAICMEGLPRMVSLRSNAGIHAARADRRRGRGRRIRCAHLPAKPREIRLSRRVCGR